MKSRKSSSTLLLVIIFICCYQDIWAGVVVKQRRAKNSTNVGKDTTSTTKHPKVMQNVKTTMDTTTTTSTTTLKPEVETVKPLDIDLDGRSAYVNNQYIDDEETSMPDNSPPLYEILQQQMETVLSNTGNNVEVYADSSQLKGSVNDEANKERPPGKPMFSFDVNQFDEYDEEENGEEDATYTEEQPENCEDTEESLTESDGATSYGGQPTQASYSDQQQTYNGETVQNSPDNSPQSPQNKPLNNLYYTTNYAADTNSNQDSSKKNYGQTNKPIQHSQEYSYGQSNPTDKQQSIQKPSNKPLQNTRGQSKPKPSSNTNYKTSQGNNGSSKPLHQLTPSPQSSQSNYGQPKPVDQQYNDSNQKPAALQNSYDKSNKQQSPKPQHNSAKSPQNSQKPNIKLTQNPFVHRQNKPNKPVQNNNNVGNNANSISQTASNPSYGNPNVAIPSSSDLSNGNSNPFPVSSSTEPSNPGYGNSNFASPSSPSKPSYDSNTTSSLNFTTSPFSSTSGNNKFPYNDRRRHLNFKIVSSSTQFVSTPLADLMFKFSVGMAKPASSRNGAVNQPQIYSINDIEK